MTMFSFNRVGARPNASARNPSTAASDRQPFAVRLASDVLVAAGILALFGLIAWILPAIGEPIGPKGVPSQVSTNLADLPYYALRSVFRMFVALFFSLVFTFIYGTAAARCRRLSRVLIPLLDILQSVPILGFLSVHHHHLDGAVPRLDAGRGGRVDFRNLHQSGLEHGVLVHPVPDQRTN